MPRRQDMQLHRWEAWPLVWILSGISQFEEQTVDIKQEALGAAAMSWRSREWSKSKGKSNRQKRIDWTEKQPIVQRIGKALGTVLLGKTLDNDFEWNSFISSGWTTRRCFIKPQKRFKFLSREREESGSGQRPDAPGPGKPEQVRHSRQGSLSAGAGF